MFGLVPQLSKISTSSAYIAVVREIDIAHSQTMYSAFCIRRWFTAYSTAASVDSKWGICGDWLRASPPSTPVQWRSLQP